MSASAPRHCMILTGGRGTRLGALTDDAPKPMLPVAGQPFLGWLVENLRLQGIARITILAGYLGEQIAAFFAGQPDVAVLIEPEPLGTGGAIRFAQQQDALTDTFFVINGDTYFDVNLADLAQLAASAPQAVASIALRQMPDTGRYGLVVCDGERITDFAARPATQGQPGTVNGGIYCVTRAIADWIGPGMVSLEADVFPRLVAQGLARARVYDAPFLDIGVPDDYAYAQHFLPAQLSRPALFLDRDGVINVDIGHLHRVEDFVWIDGALSVIKRASDLGYHVFVVTNQGGVAKGLYDEAAIAALHGWLVDQVWAAGGHISGIRYCPHNPLGTVPAYSVTCDWRKPGAGMLLDLIARHRVDVAASVMVGDRETDMQAAAAAGLRGVLFKGGSLWDTVAPMLSRKEISA